MAFLPVAVVLHVVDALKKPALRRRERPSIWLSFQTIELAFDASLWRRRWRQTAALGDSSHARPIARLGDARRIERAFRVLPDQGQKVDQLGIVVEHLLEMRISHSESVALARKAAAR